MLEQINFFFHIDQSIVQQQDNIINGWAPAFDQNTGIKIGYINFNFVSQPKYINKNIQDGYFNTHTINFIFDNLQKNETPQLFTYNTQINFSSIEPFTRLKPGNIFDSKLISNTELIKSESHVKLNVLENGYRFYDLFICKE
jgi:hypothetical protein